MAKFGNLKEIFKKFQIGQCSAEQDGSKKKEGQSSNPIGQPSVDVNCSTNQNCAAEINPEDRRRVEGESGD